jgi:hypothetical protein
MREGKHDTFERLLERASNAQALPAQLRSACRCLLRLRRRSGRDSLRHEELALRIALSRAFDRDVKGIERAEFFARRCITGTA